jgi:hypothetical protein
MRIQKTKRNYSQPHVGCSDIQLSPIMAGSGGYVNSNIGLIGGTTSADPAGGW